MSAGKPGNPPIEQTVVQRPSTQAAPDSRDPPATPGKIADGAALAGRSKLDQARLEIALAEFEPLRIRVQAA